MTAVTEIVTLPAKAASFVLSLLAGLFDAKGAGGGPQQAAAADEAAKEVWRARNERVGTDELRDVARRLQRAALYKSKAHDTADGIIAELPSELAQWVRALRLTECKILSELPLAHVVDHLRNRRPALHGVRTLSEILTEQRAAYAPPAPAAPRSASAHTDEQQAVLDKLAERLLACGRLARTADDIGDACTIH